jgi:hypothetical protein
MKHVPISDALKAKLKHPKDIIAEFKNKAPALAVVDKALAGNGGCFICGEEHFARDCPQGGGGGSAQARGRSKGRGKGKDEGKGITQPRAKSKPRPNSPVPPHASGKVEGEKTNKDIEKEHRLPGFCSDFQEDKCNRDIVSQNPTRCKIGAHMSPEQYKRFKEKNKEAIKAAKATRNSRSQSAAPR